MEYAIALMRKLKVTLEGPYREEMDPNSNQMTVLWLGKRIKDANRRLPELYADREL